MRQRVFPILCLVGLVEFVHAQSAESTAYSVDLSPNETVSLEQADDGHVLSNPWWRNLEIHGFGAAGYYDTGSNGAVPSGSFSIKEASLFIYADVWEDIELFVEFQTNRLGKDDQLFTRTGEVYVHFRDLIDNGWLRLGLKAGRMDIPFGEEYLWQDAIDNPMITNSASYPYGWDEGLLIYGDIGRASFVAAIADGTDERSAEDDPEKAVNLKIGFDVSQSIAVSFSAMRNGNAAKSAMEFGGSHFEPVGASHVSSIGASNSETVDGTLYQVDGKFGFADDRAYVAVNVGQAKQDDDEAAFDRDFRWYGIEAFYQLSPAWYAIGRVSEIGTYDANEGYHFDGKIYANGNSAFGYDTRSFRRFGIGLGFQPNPRTRIKFEVGRDEFELIDASTLGGTGSRGFAGAEIAVGF